MINVGLKAENLSSVLNIHRAFGIGASVADGYNKVKDKFSKKEEGTASVGQPVTAVASSAQA